MKVVKSHINMTPNGGIVPILKRIKELKLPLLINKCLGKRTKQSKYSYSDIIIAWMLTNLCGGERLDHISKLRKTLSIIPDLKLPSHDTLGRAMKKLSTEIITNTNVHRGTLSPIRKLKKKRSTYSTISTTETNNNIQLSELLVQATKKMGLLKSNEKYTLDMDATLIPTNCISSKRSYKKVDGFLPMVSLIKKLPVYIEMRNGNSAPSADIIGCTKKTIELLEKHSISIDKVRMDSGGYSKPTFDYLENLGIKFYVGGVKKPVVIKRINEATKWERLQMETANNFWDVEATSIMYRLTGGEHEYRLIVLRSKLHNNKPPYTWVGDENYAYKLIITNDFDAPIKEVVEFYNQRGTSERNFDTLKNDFGWRLPPFCNMNENTVFLIIGALTNNLFQALLKTFKKKIPQIKLKSRLREFIFTFVSVCCSIENDTCTFYNTDIAYEKIC